MGEAPRHTNLRGHQGLCDHFPHGRLPPYFRGEEVVIFERSMIWRHDDFKGSRIWGTLSLRTQAPSSYASHQYIFRWVDEARVQLLDNSQGVKESATRLPA